MRVARYQEPARHHAIKLIFADNLEWTENVVAHEHTELPCARVELLISRQDIVGDIRLGELVGPDEVAVVVSKWSFQFQRAGCIIRRGDTIPGDADLRAKEESGETFRPFVERVGATRIKRRRIEGYERSVEGKSYRARLNRGRNVEFAILAKVAHFGPRAKLLIALSGKLSPKLIARIEAELSNSLSSH